MTLATKTKQIKLIKINELLSGNQFTGRNVYPEDLQENYNNFTGDLYHLTQEDMRIIDEQLRREEALKEARYSEALAF